MITIEKPIAIQMPPGGVVNRSGGQWIRLGQQGRLALAFLRRDFQTQISYRLGFLIHVAQILALTCIFYFIAQTVGTAVTPYLGRYPDYFHFALLGIAFYPFINISVTSIPKSVEQYQQDGTLEMLCLSPTPLPVMLIFSTLWDYCDTLLGSLIYLATAWLLLQAQLDWGNLLLVGPVLFFTICANLGLGFINASFVLVTKRAGPLAQLMAMATYLLAGVYYPTAVLPTWLQQASALLPATHAFHALRGVLLQDASWVAIQPALLALMGFSIILLPLGLVTLHWAVAWAKREGSLAHF